MIDLSKEKNGKQETKNVPEHENPKPPEPTVDELRQGSELELDQNSSQKFKMFQSATN